MPRFLLLTLGLIFLWNDASASDRIAIIVNADNPQSDITEQTAADLYLGRSRTFPNGEYALVFDYEQGDLRKDFFHRLTGQSLQKIDRYWSWLRFTGQIRAPHVVDSESDVISVVARNLGAIGYVRQSLVDNDPRVRVVLVVE